MKTKTFHYLTNCVGCTGDDVEALGEMVEQEREITWRTFLKHVPIEEIRTAFPMFSWRGEYICPVDGKPTTGFHIKDAYGVSFHKSKFRGELCYYVWYSAIEYIWTEVK